MNTNHSELSFWDRNRILIKAFLVGFLIVIMLIPHVLVMQLVNERQNRQAEVVQEVSSKWADAQTITGPVLMLPYKEYVELADAKGKAEERKIAFILPDQLHISGNLQPNVKKRSLYSVLLYASQLKLEGSFDTLAIASLQIPPENILWSEARIVMHVSDVRGIEDQVALTWNGSKMYMEAGVPENKLMTDGLSAPVIMSSGTPASFAINLNIRGSENLYFVPVGKITETDITAPWKDPAFDGQYLPVTSTITGNSFTAHWKILPLSRTYPQCWKDNSQELGKAAYGVRLIQTVDGYSKTSRSVKYALLFIALTFTFFFFLEILLKKQIHALQYILIGLALIVFYTLLLAISEYTGYNIAYFIASFATITLIGMYVSVIFKNGKTTFGFTAALTVLYAYIFILIQAEDRALLFGSIGLFLVIAIIMYYSRNVDWYGVTKLPVRAVHEDEEEVGEEE